MQREAGLLVFLALQQAGNSTWLPVNRCQTKSHWTKFPMSHSGHYCKQMMPHWNQCCLTLHTNSDSSSKLQMIWRDFQHHQHIPYLKGKLRADRRWKAWTPLQRPAAHLCNPYAPYISLSLNSYISLNREEWISPTNKHKGKFYLPVSDDSCISKFMGSSKLPSSVTSFAQLGETPFPCNSNDILLQE